MRAVAAEVKQLRVIALVAIAAAMATSSACTTTGAPADPVVLDPEFADQLARSIEAAEDNGAHPDQIAILEGAQRTGEITFEAYNEAIDRSLRCMRDAGAGARDHGVVEHYGVRLRDYSTSAAAEAADPFELPSGVTVHRCFGEHSLWVEMVYQTQPTSVEAREAHFAQFREAIVNCLAEHGIEVEPDLSRWEMAAQFSDPAAEETEIYNNCEVDAGYTGE